MDRFEACTRVKETIAYIIAYAPDAFPFRDYCAPDEQIDLDRAYSELRAEFGELSKAVKDDVQIAQCLQGIEESYQHYKAGDMKAGILKIQEVLHAVMKM